VIESGPKGELTRQARLSLRGFVIDRLEEISNTGIPDLVITGLNYTSWWEVKLAKPVRKSDPGFKLSANPDAQQLKLIRLASAGFARYIIYDFSAGSKEQVRIVHPRQLHVWKSSGVFAYGFDHDWVIEYLRGVHIHHGYKEEPQAIHETTVQPRDDDRATNCGPVVRSDCS
jgi:hypothetical protein